MLKSGEKFKWSALSLCILGVFAAGVFAQPQPPKTPIYGVKRKLPPSKKLPGVVGDSEKSLVVDANVAIKLCVLEGKLKITGWERNEVRVFVKDGGSLGFKILEKDAATGKPVWILVTGERSEQPTGETKECLSGGNIEIDVPLRSSLSLSGRVAETTVDSVKKVGVKNIGGDITLRNISGGIMAATYEGDVTVENSGGSISLESSTGNIVAFEVSPGQIGDLFKAKTNNGLISLQKVDHRQIEANSISGSVLFNGKFLSGGLYNFKTSNGSIKLTIPHDSSCTITAAYGFGSFNSDIPLNIVTENVSPGGKNVVATIASGNATVNLTTNSGHIGIRKQ